MWSPSATGSRQANSTISARCKGGKLLGASQAWLIQQQSIQPALLIAAADTPDGRPVTFQPSGNGADGLSRGNRENDARMLDLEPSQAPAVRYGAEHRQVSGDNHQAARFTTTHGASLPYRT